MRRKIEDALLAWKNNPKRMPLILNGARQVGKTYILKSFGKQYYDNTVHINLETNLLMSSVFADNITPERVIELLEAATHERILPEKTLLILDEIQSNERALLALKVFCEDAPQYHVAAAGSLLGVAVNRELYSFPVGKVDELYLFPLDFEEYMWALDRETLALEVRNSYMSDRPLADVLHEEAIELYKKYLVTGGMPAVVSDFVESGSLVNASYIKSRILNEYVADMAKYANPSTTVKIRACYDSIPSQLAKDNKKFQYKVVQRGGTATFFGEAIEWLNFAGIVLKCRKVEHGLIPVAVSVDLSDFKLYMGDTGLLTQKSGIPEALLLSPMHNENIFSGALTENYVAQAFVANEIPLYYWKNNNTAEVDFVIQIDAQVVPVEVKASIHTRSKSLGIFMERYKCDYGIRISQKNFGFSGNIKSVPLYAVFCIQNHFSRSH